MASRRNIHLIEQLAEQWEPRLRTAFMQAVREIVSSINLPALVALLERGEIEAALRAINIDPGDFVALDREIVGTFNAGGVATAASLPVIRAAGQVLRPSFNSRDLLAEEWTRNRSGTLITEIVDDQRTMIRSVLTNGMVEGFNPRATALGLVGGINRATGERSGGVIGLTTAQEEWVRRYAAELADPAQMANALTRSLRDRRFDRTVAKAIREGTPIPADLREKMIRAYRNRALNYRADTIARTETLTALNESHDQAFRQLVASGAIGADSIVRTWRTAGDHRVRDEHRAIPGMNIGGVGLDEPFQTPSGPAMRPPLGPNCRCVVTVQIAR